MIIKVYYDHVLAGPAEDSTDFAKTTKVLLDHVLPVVGWRHIHAPDDGAVGGRHAAQALRALPAYATSRRGCDAEVGVGGFCGV